MTLKDIITYNEQEIARQAKQIGSLPGLVDWFTNAFADDIDEQEYYTSSQINAALANFFPQPIVNMTKQELKLHLTFYGCSNGNKFHKTFSAGSIDDAVAELAKAKGAESAVVSVGKPEWDKHQCYCFTHTNDLVLSVGKEQCNGDNRKKLVQAVKQIAAKKRLVKYGKI